MARALLIAVLILAAFNASAFAQSRSVDTGSRYPGWGDPTTYDTPNLLSGPFLEGEDVVWAEVSRTGRAVVADGPSGRRTLHVSPEARTRFALDVADGRAALTAFAIECPPSGGDPDDPCGRYRGESPRRFLLHEGPVAGPLAAREGACPATLARVTASALALDCFDRPWTVYEDDGAVRGFGQVDAEVAGDLIAQHEGNPGAVSVRRRASGEEVLRVANTSGWPLALAADGTVAYVLGSRQIGWSSPQAPEPHAIDVPFEPRDVRLAGDLIAIRERGYRDPGISRFAVVDRSGRLVATHEADLTEAEWDFDGRRLAYFRRPCSLAQVVVRDIADRSITDPTGGCARVAPLPRAATVSRDRRVRVRLRCPRAAGATCGGQLRVKAWYAGREGRPRRAYVVPSFGLVDLEPGERQTRTFVLALRELLRARRAWLEVTVHAARTTARRRSMIRLRLPRRLDR